MSLFNKSNKKIFKKGFSIVELTVVIVVIGILASLVFIAYPNFKRNAIENALKSDLINAKSGLASSMNFLDHFPSTADCNTDNPPDGCPKDTDETVYYYLTPEGYTDPDNYELYATRDGIVYKITNDSEPVRVSTNIVINISVFSEGGCANSVNGKVYCWGKNVSGENNKPVEIKGLNKVKTISAAENIICAIVSGGKVYCIGSNYKGLLGAGIDTDKSTEPVQVKMTGNLSSERFKFISVTYDHVCGVATNSKTYCWGNNEYGQLGNGEYGEDKKSNVPVEVKDIINIKQISTFGGYQNSCAIASDLSLINIDSIFCWGFVDIDNIEPKPVLSSPISNMTFLSPNGPYCAINSNNNVYCWDGLRFTNLDKDNSIINDSYQVKYISRSKVLTCAITIQNESYCEIPSGKMDYIYDSDYNIVYKKDAEGNYIIVDGRKIPDTRYNYYGRLGDGTNDNVAFSNRQVLTSNVFKKISAINQFACALSIDYQVYCWGMDSRKLGYKYNNIGTGDLIEDHFYPTQVIFPSM